jgi:iron complex outermembrane receptor protein
MMKKYYLKVSFVAMLACAGGLPAWAQTAAPASQTTTSVSGGTDLEEIVVTARRRSENIENVPATITALDDKALIERDIHTETDLQSAVPGLTFRTASDGNQLSYVIRGEAQEAYSGSVPGVQPYVNEVPLTANTATSFYDLGSIQVLKGPQGTLFGRNSTGGAVLFTTAQPTNNYGGYVSVQYDNLNKLIEEGAVNLPIDEKLQLRIAETYTSGGNYVHNLYDGNDYGESSQRSVRFTLLQRLTDALTNVTTMEFSDITGNNAPLFPYYVAPCSAPVIGVNTCAYSPSNPNFESLLHAPKGTYFPGYPNGFVYPGGLATLPGFLKSQGDWVVDADAVEKHSARIDALQNVTTFEVAPTLTIKNIFGLVYTHVADDFDNDGTPYPLLKEGDPGSPGPQELDTETRVYTEELQFQGNAFDKRLSYIIGTFFVSENDDNNFPGTGLVIPQAPPAPQYYFGPFGIRYHSYSQDKSFALFTQGTFAVTDQLNLTLGIRETVDWIKNHQAADSLNLNPAAPFQSTNESNPSWTVTLDDHFTPELMGYLTTRGSWRVGGFDPYLKPLGNNVTAANGGNYFNPEKVKDLELGLKYNGHIGGVPFQWNGDVFNQWADNIQKTAYLIINGAVASGTVDVPAGETSGVETDFQVRPLSWLRIGSSLSYDYSRYTRNQANIFGYDVLFGPYSDAPRFSGTIYSNITVPLAGNGETLTYHTDLYGQTYDYFGNLGALTPGTKFPGYTLLTMRLDWANPLEFKGLTVSGFVKNLGNSLYYTGGDAAAALNSDETANLGQPRTYGVAIRYDF